MAAPPPASATLKGLCVLEKDVNGDVLVWAFPAIDKTLEGVVKNRSGLMDSVSGGPSVPSTSLAANVAASIAEAPFRFSRFQQTWIYTLSVPVDSAAAKARKITAISIAILSSAYNPTKNNDLLKILVKTYTENECSTAPLLQSYLSIVTTNKLSSSFGAFDDASYDSRRAMIAPLKYLVSTFQSESILIWIAMLLKKRVVVYHPRLSEVMNLVKIFPLLGAWHRQDLTMLRPFVNPQSEVEVEELRRAGVFVAGVTEDVQAKKDLYDVYIDFPSRTFAFSTADGSPPSDFKLTKFHRTTVEAFVAAAASENDQGVIKVVAQQTREFLDKLQTLKSEDPNGMITQEGLAAAGLPPAMQAWIYAVASAEGLTKK